jgi:hypothetical protein
VERLTERERNLDGSGISSEALIDRLDNKNGVLNCHAKNILTKLADYEDAEEQGLLQKLPCKVGDDVYVVTEMNLINVYVVWTIVIESTGLSALVRWKDGFTKQIQSYFTPEDIGKTVFLTREEAEKALETRT